MYCDTVVGWLVGSGVRASSHICLVLPMPPWPACDAPTLVPDWRPMVASLPCLICSSVKFLSFLVAILGPIWGPVYSGWFCVALPREKRQRATCDKFLASNKSGVWNTSSSGTPYFLAAVRKDCTFSIRRKAGPFSLNFLTLPGASLFISLHKMTPFCRTSEKSPSGRGSSITASIHSRISFSCSGFLGAMIVVFSQLSSGLQLIHYLHKPDSEQHRP